jgi:hypothetical protein
VLHNLLCANLYKIFQDHSFYVRKKKAYNKYIPTAAGRTTLDGAKNV